MDQMSLMDSVSRAAQALQQDALMRGTGRQRETDVRRALDGFAAAYAEVLPSPLYEALMDHLTRTDATGRTLCFWSPLRATLLAEVTQWANTTTHTVLDQAPWQWPQTKGY